MNQSDLIHLYRKLHPSTVVAMWMSSSCVYRSKSFHQQPLLRTPACLCPLAMAGHFHRTVLVHPPFCITQKRIQSISSLSAFSSELGHITDWNWPTSSVSQCVNGRMHVSIVATPSSKKCKYSLWCRTLPYFLVPLFYIPPQPRAALLYLILLNPTELIEQLATVCCPRQ